MSWIRDLFDPRARKWEEFYRNRWQHDKVVRSTHGVNCTGGCSWMVYVKNGIVTWELQATDYPRLAGELPPYEPRGCQRGISTSWYVYRPLRVKYPYLRGALMQNDIVATPAQRLLKLLTGLRSDDAETAAGLRLLQAWDGTMDRNSAAAALYEVWSAKYLRTAVLKAGAGEAAALAAPGDAASVLLLLESPSGWMSPAERDVQLLLHSIPSAVRELTTRLGSDMAQWTWGALHRARFRHPLSPVAGEATRKQLDVGDWSMSGSSVTPMAGSYGASDYRLIGGASFRMVLDVGNWDASRVINAPGQSGNPASPNYADLAPLWLAGKYVPLLYSLGAVERETVEGIRLTPAR